MVDYLSSMPSGSVKYAYVMGGGQNEEEEPMTFKARITASMTRKTWGKDAMTLREKWEEKYGAAKTPSRQTFYAWLKADNPRIEPEKLFDLGELLDVNPAWLALKSDNMTRPITPGDDLSEFLDAYKHLNKEGREELMDEANREARKQLRIHKYGTAADPFKKTRTT